MRIPDDAQIGWRVWAVQDDMLVGPISGHVWPKGQPCRANPHLDVSLRVCAAATREGVDELVAAWGPRWDRLVAGRVALWGRVKLDELSARSLLLTADRGYPLSLDEGPEDALGVLRASYGL